MNISSSDHKTYTNRGFLTKKIPVSYQAPKMLDDENIGLIPETERWSTAPTSPRTPEEVFVPSTKENPVELPGFRNRVVRVDETAVVDENGGPVMEKVEQTLELPGPKGEAVGNIVASTIIGAVTASAPGMLGLGLGIVGFILGGRAAGDIIDGAGKLMLGGLAVGGTLGLVGSIVSNADKFSATNKIEWEDTPITAHELKGFNRSSRKQGSRYLETFTPVIEEKELGRYRKPVVS